MTERHIELWIAVHDIMQSPKTIYIYTVVIFMTKFVLYLRPVDGKVLMWMRLPFLSCGSTWFNFLPAKCFQLDDETLSPPTSD